jgi:cullin 2
LKGHFWKQPENISGKKKLIKMVKSCILQLFVKFRQEASRLLQEGTIFLYMEKVLQRRDEEDLRSRKFLHPSSYSKVRSEFVKIMIADHLAAIHNECPTMVEQNQYEDLRNAYELLKVRANLNAL